MGPEAPPSPDKGQGGLMAALKLEFIKVSIDYTATKLDTDPLMFAKSLPLGLGSKSPVWEGV